MFTPKKLEKGIKAVTAQNLLKENNIILKYILFSFHAIVANIEFL